MLNHLEEKHRRLRDIGFGNDFLDMTQKAQATTTTKLEKLDFIKIKNFSASKNTIKREKRQPLE